MHGYKRGYFIASIVRTKKQLDTLVKHGAGGAFILESPEIIIEWLLSPPNIT